MRALETKRLLLRKFHSVDLKDIAGWEEVSGASSAEVAARGFLDFCFREYRAGGIGPWAMLLKESRKIVGNCGFPHLDLKRNSAEVNYYVSPKHRGLGLATEALKALMRFGFEDMGLVQILARCDGANVGSERVMQKAGMTFKETVPPDRPFGQEGRAERLYVALRVSYFT